MTDFAPGITALLRAASYLVELDLQAITGQLPRLKIDPLESDLELIEGMLSRLSTSVDRYLPTYSRGVRHF